MSIAEFIQKDVLLPRLGRVGVLVVHDPARRYREVCVGLAGEGVQVVDATESGIESRETALRVLGELARSGSKATGLLV